MSLWHRHGYAADLPHGLRIGDERPPRSSPTRLVGVRATPGPYPPDLSRRFVEGRKTLVPHVLLPVSLAAPAPSGSADTPRLCQGCSRLPRHHPDQAALSFTGQLRQTGGGVLSPPLE